MLILLEFHFFNFLRAVKLTQNNQETKLKNEDKDNFKI